MKPIYYFLILCISFHLFGCGGSVNNMKLENTPESVAVNFVEALYRGDIEKARSLELADLGSEVNNTIRKWKDKENTLDLLSKENQQMKITVLKVSEPDHGTVFVTLQATNFVNMEDWTKRESEQLFMMNVYKDSRNKEDEKWKVTGMVYLCPEQQ